VVVVVAMVMVMWISVCVLGMQLGL
jgi:hypothetical protein